MDRVRDLVAAGGVSVVLAQDRDRFVREPAYHYLLKREFEEYGTKIRALNDRGDDSPEGDLTDGILDQIAKFERAKIAERTRRGRLRRAREGNIVPTRTPDYGFRYTSDREGYEVDPEQMAVVRRIFDMVGAEGKTLHAARKILDREGVPTPGRARYWSTYFIRSVIRDDVYRPHTYAEVRELVAPEVAARLDPEKRYGVWYYNVTRRKRRQVAQIGPDGSRVYARRSQVSVKPKSEWIAVPVPDPGIPRELVDAARDAIKDNRSPASSQKRCFRLAGDRNHALRRLRQGDVDQHRHEQEPPLLPLPDQAGQRQGSLRGHEPPRRHAGSRGVAVRSSNPLRPRAPTRRPGRHDRDEAPGSSE
jgi:site-specific DNA recombinase